MSAKCDADTTTSTTASTKPRDAISPSPFVESVAGLTAGSIATLAVHPLDVVKTRMQIYRTTSPTPTPPTTLSILRSLLDSPNPLSSLYRGLSPNLLGSASSWASFFFLKTRIERRLLDWKVTTPLSPPISTTATKTTATTTNTTTTANPTPTPAATSPRSQAIEPSLSPIDFFIASGLAGAGTAVLANPIWVLKTRLLSSDRSAAGAYPGLVSGARRLWHEEGWRGFYRGVGVSLLGVSHGAVQFAVYEPAKRLFLSFTRHQRHERSEQQSRPPNKRSPRLQDTSPPSSLIDSQRLPNQATIVLSTASKLVAGIVTYPYQVIRSRLQNYDAERRFGKGAREVVARLWKEEGIRGFYRGVVAGWVRVMPATWVTFVVYENTRFYLPQWLD